MNRVEKVVKSASFVASDYRYVVIDNRIYYLQRPMHRVPNKIKRALNHRFVEVNESAHKKGYVMHIMDSNNRHMAGYYGDTDLQGIVDLIADGVDMSKAVEICDGCKRTLEKALCWGNHYEHL